MLFTIISKLVGIILILCGLLFVATAVGYPITDWIPRFALPKEIIIGILLMVGGKLLYGTARVFVVGRGRGY
jgi:drug/metabolite transporter (DMT)-like permease